MAKGRSETPSRTAARMHDVEHAQLQRLMKRLHTFRARFKQLHARGKAALDAHDYEMLGDAIRREADLIKQHRALIDQQRALVKRRLARSRAPRIGRR